MSMPSRRRVLQAATTLLALPSLDSLGFRRFARAAAAVRPKRMVCLGIGYGVTEETWFPKKDDVGAGYTLTEGLAPLARHKNGFTIVQGCTHAFAGDPHGGSTVWLTGAGPTKSLSMDRSSRANLVATRGSRRFNSTGASPASTVPDTDLACLWPGIAAASR